MKLTARSPHERTRRLFAAAASVLLVSLLLAGTSALGAGPVGSRSPAAVDGGPVLETMIPTIGRPGTQVTITGKGIAHVTSVRFNRLSARFVQVSATKIVVTVPAGAHTGPVTVVSSSGSARTSVPFRVTPADAPLLTLLSPTEGPPGTKIALGGRNLAPLLEVRFNGVNAKFISLGPLGLYAFVPQGATTGKVSVTTGKGTAETGIAFRVGGPAQTTPPPNPIAASALPFLDTMIPTIGPPGAKVTITGRNIEHVKSVRFAGGSAQFVQVSGTKIVVTVPSGARTGPVVVVSGAGTAQTSVPFKVTPAGAPLLTFLSPVSGRPGTHVVIGGTNIEHVLAVRFNGVEARFTQLSPTRLRATVPEKATTGKVTVTTSKGTATTDVVFTVA